MDGAAVRQALGRVSLFASLSDEDRDWIASLAEPVAIGPGELLAAEGSPGDELYAVVEGELEVVKRSGIADVPIARVGPGEILGEMAVLEDAPRMASVRAVTAARLLRIRRETMLELLRTRPSATISIIRTVMSRLRSTEAMLRERERLAALGTLSAGLAHELNNPAAAVQRSAGLLQAALDGWAAATRALGSVVDDREHAELIADLGGELARDAGERALLDPLEASDRASVLEELLAASGVQGGGDLAPALASLGLDAAHLQRIEDAFPGPAFPIVVGWIGAGSLVHSLVDEVATGAGRISEIVRAVKEYAYMGQAPVQRIDVKAGLDNTLVILRPKLKGGIRVRRDYDPALPTIEAYGSELNQVWTNILDNAIDALGGQGEIRIRTRLEDGHVVVELCDDGPGMPADVRQRIFEPFFTTKPPGSGTGLGLHIAHNVVARHGGRIEVRSRPGQTCFDVWLPVT